MSNRADKMNSAKPKDSDPTDASDVVRPPDGEPDAKGNKPSKLPFELESRLRADGEYSTFRHKGEGEAKKRAKPTKKRSKTAKLDPAEVSTILPTPGPGPKASDKLRGPNPFGSHRDAKPANKPGDSHFLRSSTTKPTG